MAVQVVAPLGILAVAAATFLDLRSPDTPPATVVGAGPSREYTSVPEAQVAAAHGALHALGEACGQDPGSRPREAVDQPVGELLDFARRHPDGRFAIDDESGTSLSLLLVVREELRGCAPDAVPAVEALIPDRYLPTS